MADDFERVLKTLSNNKVMVSNRPDGVYIRLAGDANKGEYFMEKFIKVTPQFDDDILS